MPSRAAELRQQLIRDVDSAPRLLEQRDPLSETDCARLAEGTAARNLGVSYDVVAPDKGACPYHFHHVQEELFVILRGEGTVRVAGELLPVSAGDVVFIPPGPEYPHQLVNSSNAPLAHLSISTKSAVEIVEYPDSQKVLARGPGREPISRVEDGVDYWAREP